ncbi:MAG: hypothetical protein M4579_001639 [Chaenotheca gracillima]|nr:MAG: hypothetical protein M4579_001639 [Chaenotheca gracillima]
MSTDYNYDDQGQFFPYFVLTMSGLVTLPLTYSLLKPSKEIETTAPRIHTDFKLEDAEVIERQKAAQRRRERKVKRIVAAVIGWVAIAWMIYLIMVTARTMPKLWDPYDILGISRSLDEKAIKSHYKRLSLRFHPDKVRPDPSKNQTIDSLNDHFVEITKAYKALTDEEVRNNYIQYGHPDGKQSFSIGIALPKFIVTEGNGKYVLLVYGVLLGVLLPYVVGKWWYGSQRMTKEKVLITSAGNLFKEYEDNMTEGGVLGALSSGDEFKEILYGDKADAGLAKIEGRILSDETGGALSTGASLKDRSKLESLDGGSRRKALGLLWAYVGRVDLATPSLNEEKYEVAPTALALNESLLAIALAFGNIGPVLSSFHTSQNLIQALAPKSSPLIQLPYLTRTIASSIEGPGARSHLSVQEFMQISDEKRRQLAVGPGLLSDTQYQKAIEVARQLPVLKVEKAFFKVTGERFITPSSLVQFVVKGRIIPPGSTNVPEVNELDLEDVDPEEGDVNAILGRKAAKNKNVNANDPKSTAAATDEKPIQPPLAFAPYFPRDHSPRWHVFLADSKQGKMAVPPFTFSTFNKPLFTESGEASFAVQTFKMQFQAPPQAGKYTFVMNLVCDSYVGMDTKMEVTLSVDDISRAEEMDSDDDISEPDEDSLAGQMNALKTGGTAPPSKKKKKPAVEESSEDESDTEGEDGEEDTSDTDTDTDTDDE